MSEAKGYISFEDYARLKKAIKLTDLLDAGGFTVEMAKKLKRLQWQAVLYKWKPGIKPPSTKTQELIVGLLASRLLIRAEFDAFRQKKTNQVKLKEGISTFTFIPPKDGIGTYITHKIISKKEKNASVNRRKVSK